MSNSNHRENAISGNQLSGATAGIPILASAVQSSSGTGSAVINHNFARATVLICVCDLTASSTPTTLDVAVEASLDGGTLWFTLAKFSQFGAVASGRKMLKVSAAASQAFSTEVVPVTSPTVSGAAAVNNFAWDTYLRAHWAIAGTSYTFSVSVIPILTA